MGFLTDFLQVRVGAGRGGHIESIKIQVEDCRPPLLLGRTLEIIDIFFLL